MQERKLLIAPCNNPGHGAEFIQLRENARQLIICIAIIKTQKTYSIVCRIKICQTQRE